MTDERLQKEFKRIIKQSAAYSKKRPKNKKTGKTKKEHQPRYESFEEWEKAHPETVELVNKAPWMQDKVCEPKKDKYAWLVYLAAAIVLISIGWTIGMHSV